jgi:hypothetical protein
MLEVGVVDPPPHVFGLPFRDDAGRGGLAEDRLAGGVPHRSRPALVEEGEEEGSTLFITDTTGSTATNQRLSEQRAQAVADYIAARGVARSRLATKGYGETYDYLRVKTADNVNEPLNRRVEIKIIPISQEDVSQARSQ